MENKTSKNIWLTIMGVLIIVALISRICVISDYTVSGIPLIIALIFTALYGFKLYKKPHGNMLKYAMLIFSFAIIISAIDSIIIGASYLALETMPLVKLMIGFKVARIFCAAFICYGAGRLNKIETNKILFTIIAIVFIAESISMAITYPYESALMMISYFNFTIGFITLMIAYFVRFKEHKEAGLMDAPKK